MITHTQPKEKFKRVIKINLNHHVMSSRTGMAEMKHPIVPRHWQNIIKASTDENKEDSYKCPSAWRKRTPRPSWVGISTS